VKFLDIRRDDDGGDVNVNIIVIDFFKICKALLTVGFVIQLRFGAL
jgi:hypothetical protein